MSSRSHFFIKSVYKLINKPDKHQSPLFSNPFFLLTELLRSQDRSHSASNSITKRYKLSIRFKTIQLKMFKKIEYLCYNNSMIANLTIMYQKI